MKEERVPLDWLVLDMSTEVKAWGFSVGPNGHIIVKSDGGNCITRLIVALTKYSGGRLVPEFAAKGKSEQPED